MVYIIQHSFHSTEIWAFLAEEENLQEIKLQLPQVKGLYMIKLYLPTNINIYAFLSKLSAFCARIPMQPICYFLFENDIQFLGTDLGLPRWVSGYPNKKDFKLANDKVH